MWRLLKSIDIEQPPDRVFDYLSHFHTVREWDATVAEARMLSASAPAVGTRFKIILGVAGRRVPMDYAITRMTPGRELVLTGTSADFDAVDRIRLEPTPAGTRLFYAVEVTFRRPRARLADAALEWMFQRHAARALKRLQRLLSGAAAAPRPGVLTRMADHAIVPGLVGFTRVGYTFARRRRPVASIHYAHRIMVLTGGTSGIGKSAARALVDKGARLIVVGRSARKLADLRNEVRQGYGRGKIETELADLSCLAEIRQLAGRINGRFGAIDVLINNAGALFNSYQETAEGIERTLATDLVSPYLLTRMLLPALKNGRGARIVNVASGGMYTQGLRPEHLHSDRETYHGPTAYARAKRGLVILSAIWARELAPLGISVHAMHPGWVDTPGLQDALPAFHRQLSGWLRTPEQGADTIVWLAGSPEAHKASGHFWLDRQIRSTHVFPHTRTTAQNDKRLVDALDVLSGFKPPAGDCPPG